MAKHQNMAIRGIIGLIKLYQVTLSVIFGPRCRFFPSCSQYSREAIEQHGIWCGLKLSSQRLCRCHPMTKGGFDPVPKK